MKKNIVRFVFVMLALSVIFPTSWASAQPTDSLQPVSTDVNYDEAGCDPDNSNAPCIAEVLESSNLWTISPEGSIRRSITCGVVVKNACRVIVAKLWETVTVTWDLGYTINSAYRYTWVKNSAYGWTDLTGPVPNSGSHGRIFLTDVKTSGSATYLGGRWRSYTIYLTISGYVNDPHWHCSMNQNY